MREPKRKISACALDARDVLLGESEGKSCEVRAELGDFAHADEWEDRGNFVHQVGDRHCDNRNQ